MKFKDFIELHRGYDLPEQKRTQGNYPIYSSTTIVGMHNDYKIKAPGVVTGRSGSLGEVQYVKENFWPLNTTLFVSDFKGNLPRYVYYFLKTLNLSRFNSGASVPTLNRNDLDNLYIDVHSFPEQHKIASILSAYDDLIEINERRIKILEEMARVIYKEWFVKFRFPGHEKVKIVESELGMIPGGWEASNLKVVLEEIESGSRPKGGVGDLLEGIPSIGAENILGLGKYDFNKTKYVSKEFFESMQAGVVRNGDVLLYKDGAQIGRKSFFDEDFPFKRCCVNEHVFILRANKRISQKYLFFWVEQPWVNQEIINLNTNAAQPGINRVSVKTLPILVPDSKLIKKFDEIVGPLIKMLFTCCKENQILRQTRDLLLPKLISGKIDVSGLDVQTGE